MPAAKAHLLKLFLFWDEPSLFVLSTIKSVINFAQNHLIVSAQTLQTNGSHLHLGIQLDGKNIEIRINQQSTQKRSDLAYALPLQLIHPKSYELLDAGSQIRQGVFRLGRF